MGGKPSAPSSSSSASTQASTATAYRPGWRDHARASSPARGSSSAAGAGEAAEGDGEDGDDDALSPELEERLVAASHVVSVPPPGYSPPKQAELTPELALELQQAVASWTSQAQQQLDRCVGRPKAARQPVQLSILFAPSTAGPVAAGAAMGSITAAPSLTPAYVAMMPDDLRRLWKDTDPDALQMCLDQLRIQPLTLSAAATARLAPGVAPPSAHESVLVQL